MAHEAWADWWRVADPLDRTTSVGSESVCDRGISRVVSIRFEGRLLYIKHMTGLKHTRGGFRRLEERLKWLLRPARSVWVWRMHRAMERAGLRVPCVVLAVRRRRGLLWDEDLLVTEAVDGCGLGSLLRDTADAAERRRLLTQVGRAVAELHNAGFLHGDLATNNLIISQASGDVSVAFIDNDRTQQWPIHPPRWVCRRNLAQIAYRIPRWREARAFLDAYFAATRGLTTRQARRELLTITRKIRRRAKRHHHAGPP